MIVVSHDGFNQTRGWRSVIVVPISTSENNGARGPTLVDLSAGSTGLRKDSIALCHQVTTLDRANLTEPLGSLSSECLAIVNAALRAALDLG